MGKLNRKQRRRKAIAHAKLRAWQRYKVKLNSENYQELVKRIQLREDATFMQRKSNRLSFWAITYEGTLLLALYDKNLSCIVTFWPANKYHNFF